MYLIYKRLFKILNINKSIFCNSFNSYYRCVNIILGIFMIVELKKRNIIGKEKHTYYNLMLLK